MPNQNRNGRKPPDRLFVRVFEDGCIGGGYAYCLTPPEGFDSVEYAQVATNQNECDHVVGAFALLDSKTVYPVFQSDEEKSQCNIDSFVKFYYCPGCGAKIDWDKIEEKGMKHTPGISEPRKHEYTSDDLIKTGWFCKNRMWYSPPDRYGWSLIENCSFEEAVTHQKAQDIFWKATHVVKRRKR